MIRALIVITGLLVRSLAAGEAWASGANEGAPGRTAWVAPIRGTIDPGTADFVSSSIRKAEAANAELLIFELDTPGGLVSSVRSMAQAIDRSRVPVVVYVGPAGSSATSAGALLTLASHLAAMAPGTHIGAAHPVNSSGKEIEGVMGQKVLNDTVAFAKGLAELRGRNRIAAESAVSKSQSFTSQEALNQGLIELLANDVPDLLNRIDGRKVQLSAADSRVLHTHGISVHPVEMSLGQQLLHWLSNPELASLLMGLGILCIYVEVTNPGVVLPGVVGVLAIVIAFVSFQLLPVRTGGLVLLALGVLFLLLEPFVVAHGIFAVAGVLAFVTGLLWVMDPARSDLTIGARVGVPIGVGLGGFALLLGWVAGRSRKLANQARAQMGGGSSLGLEGYLGRVESVQPDGRSGKVLVRGEIWDFDCETGLTPGSVVEIDQVQGMRVSVRPVKV